MLWVIFTQLVFFASSTLDTDYCDYVPDQTNEFDPSYPHCDTVEILESAYSEYCQCTRDDILTVDILGPTDIGMICVDGNPGNAYACTCSNGYPDETQLCVTQEMDRCAKCNIGFGLVGHECIECDFGYVQDTANSSEPCNLWSTCSAGSYQQGGSKTEDTTCEECPTGYFQDQPNSNERECKIWSTCDAGYKRKEDGESFKDAVCTTCSFGQYQPNDNTDVEDCIPWLSADSCVLGQRYIEGSRIKNSECIDNICTCRNGTAATAAECTQHNQNICCTQHNQNICSKCDTGFKLLEDLTCIPKYPIECTAEKMTNNVVSRISYPFGNQNQLTFAQQKASSSPTDGSKYVINYASIGTVWTQEDMSALYNPPKNSQATLTAFIQDSTWKKSQMTRSQTYSFKKPATYIQAIQRTDRVWIDRPNILTSYTLQDEDGSFYVEKMNGLSVVLGGTGLGSTHCYTTDIHSTGHRHLGTCQLSVSSVVFTSLTQDETRDMTITLTGKSGADPIVKPLPSVVVTKPPNWYHSNFRSDSLGIRPNAPINIATSSFLTLPTHAVYADSSSLDTFKAIVFINNNVHPGFAWTFQLKYDQNRITHQDDDISVSSDFAYPSILQSTDESDGQRVLTLMSSEVTEAGGANPSRRLGVYYVFSITFKFKSTTLNGIQKDLIGLNLVGLYNAGNNVFVAQEKAHIADRRDTTVSGNLKGQMEVYSNDEVGILPYHSQLGSPVFDTSKINGVHPTTDFEGTVIKRYQLSHSHHRHRKNAYLHSCEKEVEGDTNFEITLVSGRCRITYNSATTQMIGFNITEGAFTSETLYTKVTVPESISIEINDTILNQIESIDCSGHSNQYSYQTTKVVVRADGLDITSLATNMRSTNPDIADFKTTSNSEYNSYSEYNAYVQGKTVGTTTIQLFEGSPIFSDTITVSDDSVSVTNMYNRIITDVSFQPTPPSSFTYPGSFNAGVLVQQKLTQPPLGSIRAHYGYLFTTIHFSDGSEQYILGDEISTSKTTRNIVWTPPGGTDNTIPALSIQNQYSDRWMVSVAPNAYLECILDTVEATWTKCGTDMITRGVPMLIFPPAPIGIEFRILKSQMAPLNDPASYPPFNIPTSSGFFVSVEYDDGTIITSYASENNVLFYADENACGTVENGDTDTVTIESGSTCTSIKVYVNVTFGELVFQDSYTSYVRTLWRVKTTMRAYPSGSSNINNLHQLPCSNTTYERGTVQTYGYLSSGARRTLTNYMTYSTENTLVATVSDSTVIPQGPGTTSIGQLSNINLQGNMTNVAITPITFQVKEGSRSGNSYGGTWSLIDGSTISKTQNSEMTTTFQFTYTDSDGIRFVYSNFFNNKNIHYISPTDILEFSSDLPDILNISSIGTITQKENYHEKVTMRVSHKCDSDVMWTKRVWSNLVPDSEDVDLGTNINNLYAPYYFTSDATTSGATMDIHIWASPKSNQFLRGVQLEITLPIGMTGVGASFTPNAASGFSSVASFMVKGSQVMGLTSTHPATVPSTGKIRLGYFTVPFNVTLLPVTGSGLLENYMSVTIDALQSDEYAKDGASGNVRSVKESFESIAAYGRVYIGSPSRRLFGIAPAHIERPVYKRRLSSCDPCSAQIFGDIDGDCKFNVNDVTTAQTFATQYSPFSTGSISTNPLSSWRNKNGYNCSWVKQQLNPSLDLLDGNFGGDDSSDIRYQQPNINAQDVIQLSRATQFQNRFIQPSVDCVMSTEALGYRPDLYISAEVYGGVGQDTARIKSTTQTSFVGTDVYFEVVISDNAQKNQAFAVTTGDHMTTYANPYGLNGEGNNVLINTSGYYSRAPGTQAGILVKATYDATSQKYVAQLQPTNYDGDVTYYVAVAIETKMNSQITVAQTQAYSGLSTFPYSAAGYSFNPVIGSPYSTIRQSGLTCKGCLAGERRVGSSTVDPECVECEAKTFQGVAGSITIACTSWKKCNRGEKWAAGTKIVDATCTACEPGRFQPYDESEQEECTLWSTCNKGFGADEHSAIKDIECQVCVYGQFQPLDNTTNFCGDWSTCNKGNRRDDGSTTQDATCHECDTGQFQPDDNSEASSCTEWQTCDAGHRRENGTIFANAICHQCTTGQYQPNDNTIVESCIEWKTCDAGNRREVGSITQDATCHECTTGQYQPNNASNATSCTAWSRCNKGKRRENGTITQDATCHECTTGQYQPDDNSEASSCTIWKTCDAGHSRQDGSITQDATCHACTYGKYQPNNASNATSCTAWTPCQQGFGIKEVTSTSDVVCLECEYGQFQPDDNFIYTCRDWATCSAGEKRQIGNTIADATCHECTTGQYQPNDNSNATSCIEWKTCDAGNRRQIGSRFANAICYQCTNGQYQPDDNSNATSCIDWKTCDAGNRRQVGSVLADATCHECAAGQYQPNYNSEASSCIEWKTCNQGEFRIPGTLTSDAECQTCADNFVQPDSQTTVEQCTKCEAGKRSNNLHTECLQNICTCNNGTVATGASCTTHEANICVACDVGFRLQKDKTCLQIYPPSCAPDVLVKGVDAVAKYKEGSSMLSFADSTYCANDVGANDVVEVDYGFDSVLACPGTPVKVNWKGYHNIREMPSDVCTGTPITEIVGYKNSGYSETFSDNELNALPGQRRYFKCDKHCSTSSSRFEVYCPPIPLSSFDKCTLSSSKSASSGTGYSSLGVSVSQRLKTLYIPPKGTSGTLYAHVQDSLWQKNNANVYQTQSALTSRIATHGIAVLRTQRVWVDRPNIYVSYMLQDADGRFVVDTSSLSVNIEVLDTSGSSSCSTSKLHDTLYRHMDACSFTVPQNVFTGLSSDAQRFVDIKVHPLSSSSHFFITQLPSVTLIKPPDWYDPDLRSRNIGTRSYTKTSISTSSFVTLPTHPVYTNYNDEFEAIVFINNFAYPVESWTFELKFKTSLVQYNGYYVSSDFSDPGVSTTTKGTWTVVTFFCSAPSSSGTDNPDRRRGIYYALSLRFVAKAGLSAGIQSDFIQLKLVNIINSGNKAFVNNEASTILDHRNFDSSYTSGQFVVYDVENVGVLPYHAGLGGAIYDTLKLSGEFATNTFGATMITSYDLAAFHANAYASAAVTSCTKVLSTDKFRTRVKSNSCDLEYYSDSTKSLTFRVTSGEQTSGDIISKIVVPTDVRIEVSDTILNKIQSLDCNGVSDKYHYQTARVVVLADGLDVTPLATNIQSTNSFVIDLKQTDAHLFIRGKHSGEAELLLYHRATKSVKIQVTSSTVSVQSMTNRIITDIEYETRPPSSLPYSTSSQSSFLVRQILTQPPIGVTKAHYGYLYTKIIYSDGAEENIFGDEITTSSTSNNIVWTAPGESDTTVSSLVISNDYSDRWMVSVAPNAVTECVDDSVKATWTRCGSNLMTRGVPMLINPPIPESISLNINENLLTPMNDPATVSPFSLTTSSSFTVYVTYDDGTVLSSFAGESNVVYYVADDSCATVDNDANSMSIVEYSTCSSATVHVNVTFGDTVFQASDTVSVAVLSTVTTTMSAYPKGSSDITDLYQIPCVSTYERGQLNTVVELSNGQKQSMSVTNSDTQTSINYVSSDSDVSYEYDGIVMVRSVGEATYGSEAELWFPVSVHMKNVNIVPCVINIHNSDRDSNTYYTTWNLVEGTTISMESGSSSTIAEVDFTYEDASGIRFEYEDFFGGGKHYTPWDILEFSSDNTNAIEVDNRGRLTQHKNHYDKITITMNLKCSQVDSWQRSVWSNLVPSTEDVDLGTYTTNQYAPYYIPYIPSPGSSVNLHLWARPKSNQYLRSLQIRVYLPTTMTSDGASFTENTAVGYLTSYSFNQEGEQIMGLTAIHTSTIPSKNKIYLGYFTVPFNNNTSAISTNTMSVEIVSIQSDTIAADGATGNVRSASSDESTITAFSYVYVGVPTSGSGRRLVEDIERVHVSRKLSSCDPCTAEIFGDVNGDCVFNVNDVTEAQTFATAYSAFATGTISVNPLLTWSNTNGYDCDWVKQQLNPTLDLLNADYGGDDTSDVRYQQPNINAQDIIHLSRATQYMNRFIVPSLSCEDSTAEYDYIPHIKIKAAVYGGVGQDTQRVVSDTQTSIIGTDVYFEVLIADNATENQLFNVTKGTHITKYTNPYNMHGVGQNIDIELQGSYSKAEGTQAAILVKAEYEASSQTYVAQLQPFAYTGKPRYYAAVAVETKMNSQITVQQTQAFSGLSTFPYKASGFEFEPVLGSPYSSVLRNYTTCTFIPSYLYGYAYVGSDCTAKCVRWAGELNDGFKESSIQILDISKTEWQNVCNLLQNSGPLLRSENC